MSSFPSNTHSLVYSTEYMPKVAPNVYRSGRWYNIEYTDTVHDPQFVRIVNSFSRSKGSITRDNPCYNSTTWYEIADKSGHVTLKVVAGKFRPKHGLLYRPFSSYFFHLSNLKSVLCEKKWTQSRIRRSTAHNIPVDIGLHVPAKIVSCNMALI